VDTKDKKIKISLFKLIKRTELLLFIFILPILLSGGRAVKGNYVVGGVESKISLYYDEEFYNFTTFKTILFDAVTEQGFKIYEQDIFSISRDTELKGGEYEVNIVKSLPVVISDEGEHIIGRTVYSKPEKILEQNNIKYWPEDKLSIELITDPINQGGVGQLVTIKRAPVYNVRVDGKIKEIHTWDNLVSNIVEKSETKLNPNDIVKPGLKEFVGDGSTITITRIEYAEATETKAVPFTTIYKGTTTLAFGATKVSQSGINGQKKLTYKITYKNGEEVSRILIASTITRAKQDAVVLRGAVTGKASYVSAGIYPSMSTAFRGYMGHYLLVTNLNNGKRVKVKVVDYGPKLGTGRIIDLGEDAFAAIGDPDSGGLHNVMVELL